MPDGKHDLDINEDLDWEDGWYWFERFAWATLVALLVAASIGAVGPGRLSRQDVKDPSGQLRVVFEKRLHAKSSSDVQVEVGAGAARNGEVKVLLAGSLATGDSRIDHIAPEPGKTEASASGSVLTYSVPPGQGMKFVLRQRTGGIGPIWSKISVAGGPEITLDQFIFP